MSANRGKDFEKKIEEALEKLDTNKVNYLRLYDVTMGYKNIKNPSDFIVFSSPVMFYIECKSIRGNTLNFAMISQLDELERVSKTFGVKAGVIIWYIDHKETYWVDTNYILNLRDNLCAKSINIKNLRQLELPNNLVYKLDGVSKRIYTDYNLENLFDYYTKIQ